MNSVLENILETGLIRCADGQIVKVRFRVSTQEGRFLQSLIAEVKPQTSLEIGLAYGVSALFICEALACIQGTRHIIVDPLQFDDGYWKGAGLHNLEAAGYGDMIEFHGLPSHIALPKLEADGRKVDFAFIDGAHEFDYVMVDFFCVDRILKVGGIVAFDDLGLPSVQKLCRYILTNRSYKVFRCWPGKPRGRISLKRTLLQEAAGYSESLKRIVRHEYADPTLDLSLAGNRCVAFRKEAEDQRVSNFHCDF